MLSPYRVLDLTDHRGEIGPMLLGDLGADVIRVEPPVGSEARRGGPILDGAPEDLRSLQFHAFNRNKRSIVLDPASDADLESLRELIRRSDFLFESSPGRLLEEYGLDFADLEALNPRIVYVRLSAFGDDGPHADLIGNDLVVAAMGGPMSLQGAADRAPIRVSVPQVWRHAGVEAAAGALAAHARMQKTGGAQFLDLSAQSVMTWTMLNAMDAYAIQGFDIERNGSRVNTGVLKFPVVYPCRDGHMVVLPTSAAIVPCLDWMIADGVLDESARNVDWADVDQLLADPDAKPYNMDDLSRIVEQFVAKHSKQELLEFGMERDTTLAPVTTIPELLALQHFEARDYWRPLPLPAADGRENDVKSPGFWCKPSNTPLTIRRQAPSLDEHGAEIREELSGPARRAPVYPEPTPTALPFEGVKVADFAWVGVGPISSKYLADHGATVVRVESESRPDVLRGAGPFKDGEMGWNRSQFYGDFNTSKQGLSLSMKSPAALEIAKKLIAWADVFIESFAPGAIGRMGLSYEEVRKINPGIIMVSTCLMGQTGPAAKFAGYGYHAGAMAGFYEITGWPDRAPDGPWNAYTDTVAPRFISTVLAAALDHRRRTGEGQFIDVAQIETALHFQGPEILDFQSSGFMATREGNRARDAAPQGCYPCAGEDQWCVIAVDTDEQWLALRKELGEPEWARNPALDSTAGRRAAHEAIDEQLAVWTRSQDRYAVMERLQAAGVPAGVMQRSSDLLADPQYAHRGFYRYLGHPEMGNIPYAGHQYRIRGYDNGPRFHAPCLGQHSYEVMREILGMTEDEIGDAFASGAIS